MKEYDMIIRLRIVPILALLFLLVRPDPASSQVTGLSYTLAPTVERTWWDNNAALSDGQTYGGQLGFGFGRYFELNGIYLRGDDFKTDFSAYTDISPVLFPALQTLSTRTVKMERFGGEMKLNIGSGGLVPFITLGTGVLRFSPDGVERSDLIYWSGGAGVFYSPDDRFTISVSGQDLAYRYNPVSVLLSAADLSTAGLSASDFSEKTVHNWGVRAGLRVFLGGRSERELTDLDRDLRDQFSGDFSGFSINVTPFYGQVNFNKGLSFPDHQKLAGVNAGVGLGPFIGLRGFYWRGLEDGNETKFDKIQMYGGELNLKLNTGEGAIPFFLVGIGYLDVIDGYQAPPGRMPKNYPFAIAGGGLNFNLSQSIRLQGAVRSILISRQGSGVSDPSTILGNTMYSIGINFAIGGKPDKPSIVRTAEMTSALTAQQVRHGQELEKVRRDAAAMEDSLTAQISLAELRGDSLAVARMKREKEAAAAIKEEAIVRQATAGTPPADVTAVQATAVQPDTQMVDAARVKGTSNITDKVIMVPVPEEGELYVRFGKPGSVTIETLPLDPYGQTGGGTVSGTEADRIRSMTRETLGEMLAGPPGTEDSVLVDRLEQRIVARLAATQGVVPPMEGALRDSMERVLENRIIDRLVREGRLPDDGNRVSELDERLDRLKDRLDDASGRPGQTTRIVEATPPAVDVAIIDGTTSTGARGIKLDGVYTGIDFAGGPTQVLFGVKADYGTIFGDRVRVVPEFVMGFGGGTTSFLLDAAAVLPLRVERAYPVTPYVGVGIGLLSYTNTPEDFHGIQGMVSLILGGEYPMGGGKLFGEYTSINLFDLNRFQVGYRFGF